MRLCYVADARSIHTQRWLTYFVNCGHEVHLLTIYPNIPTIPGVEIHFVPPLPTPLMAKINRGQGWLSLLSSSWQIWRLVRLIRPDVLHAHYAAFFGWLAALADFHPLVITLWGGDILADQGADRFPYNKLTPFALRRADLVTGVSQRLINIAYPHLRPDVETAVIRIGADTTTFNPSVDATLWRTRLGLGVEPIVLTTRPFEPIYNLETIVGAIPYVLAEMPQVRFVLKDDTSRTKHQAYRVKIQQMIIDKQLQSAVHHVGQVPYSEMAAFYKLSDLFVSMALSDGFPVSVFEAMACGVPVILSQLPHLNELIEAERNALLVPATDSKKLAQAIIRLLQNSILRQQMVATNLELIHQHGDFEVEMQKMDRLYHQLTSKS